MTKSFSLLLACLMVGSLLLAAGPTLAAKKTEAAPVVKIRLYNPQKDYPGVFDSDRLYKIQYPGADWFGNKAPATLQNVVCGSAYVALSQTGHWTGRLDARGYCQKGDPVEYMLGKFLNYQNVAGE